MIEVQHQNGSSGNSPVKIHQDSPTRQDSPVDTQVKPVTHQKSRFQELPEPYDFRAPDKVDANRLNGKFGKAADFIEKRITVLTKIASDLLEGEEKFLEEEVKLIDKAVSFIDENLGKFKELLDKELEQKAKLEGQFSARQSEFQAAQVKHDEAREKIREVEEIIKEQAKELITLNARKEKAAVDIEQNMKQFRKVTMREPKDQGHELFKWFLGVIYNESQAKYDFENFKKEVLKKDKGRDFVERLKGFRAFGLGKEEVAQTNKLLQNEKEVTERINHKRSHPLTAVPVSFEYVKVIDRVNHIMDDMHKREVDLESAAKKVDLTGAELDKLRSRKNDAETGLQIAYKALQTFDSAHKLFTITGQRCRERQKYISESLPNLKKSAVKPQKTEAVVESKGGEEETAFGTVTHQESAKKQQHNKVRATYESDINELPPAQKEGCKCTIF
jgi:predicted  nucleic acid-binding Zn-ribbon protein